MSRAEEKALERYPREDDVWGDEWQKRVGFQEGYEQAEKDLIEKAEKWLKDIYSQFDITDSAGYVIDIDTMASKFKQAMSE